MLDALLTLVVMQDAHVFGVVKEGEEGEHAGRFDEADKASPASPSDQLVSPVLASDRYCEDSRRADARRSIYGIDDSMTES